MQCLLDQERLRGATPRPRSGAAAETSYPTSEVGAAVETRYRTPEVRAAARRSYHTPKVRGGGCQGAAAAQAKESGEELLHVQGQEGRP